MNHPPIHTLLQPEVSRAYKKQLLASLERDKHSMSPAERSIFDQTRASLRGRIEKLHKPS